MKPIICFGILSILGTLKCLTIRVYVLLHVLLYDNLEIATRAPDLKVL